jgi:hypothetical protein
MLQSSNNLKRVKDIVLPKIKTASPTSRFTSSQTVNSSPKPKSEIKEYKTQIPKIDALSYTNYLRNLGEQLIDEDHVDETTPHKTTPNNTPEPKRL